MCHPLSYSDTMKIVICVGMKVALLRKKPISPQMILFVCHKLLLSEVHSSLIYGCKVLIGTIEAKFIYLISSTLSCGAMGLRQACCVTSRNRT